MLVARTLSPAHRLAKLAQAAVLALAATLGACSDDDTLPVSPDMKPSFAKGGGTKPTL